MITQMPLTLTVAFLVPKVSSMARPQAWTFTFPPGDSARPGTEGPFYELTGEVLFPEWVELIAIPDQPDRYPHARLRLEIDEGRPICTSLTADRSPAGRPIEARTFRELDIAALIADAIEWQAHSARAIVDLIFGADSWTATPSGGRVFGDTHSTSDRVRTLRRQWSGTDDKLRQVAEVYLANEKAPTVAVMKHFQLGDAERRKAARWVAQAKERGFIPKKEG
jgi:hypothetical protein